MTRKIKGKHAERLREGYKQLRVMAEYGSSGIWAVGQQGAFRHGAVGYSALRLPTSLSRRFEAWIESYDDRLTFSDTVTTTNPAFDSEKFNAEGRLLAQALKAHVGPETYVEYLPELPDGGLGLTEVVAGPSTM